jgi:adenine-specific DNA-methyltransferase
MKKLKLHSPDLTQANVEKLATLFPSCVTEAKDEKGHLKRSIDFDLLRQELSGEIVEGPQERYQLNWPGKREALLTANAPIAKTLRPCREESVDFDTTKNLFIEGDNLDALKLLQETYLNKVKLIYIDPPYNTGSDLVYDDNFKSDASEYFLQSNQYDETGKRLIANTEANGRFHSDWLSMIYPRLKLARNLLRDDGVILISIDDNELANLKKICDEVFGAANFIATMIWEKGRKNDAKLISVGHEYILIFAKSLAELRERKTVWREEKPGAREIWQKYLELRSIHFESDSLIETDLQEWFTSLPKNHPSKKWSRYKHVDSHGPWRDDNISWPGGGGPTYDVIHPVSGLPCKVPERGWIYANHSTMMSRVKAGVVEFRKDESQPPIRKSHLKPIISEDIPSNTIELNHEDDEDDLATQVRGSYFYKQSQVSVKDLRSLLGVSAFNNPKDHVELARLISYIINFETSAIVLDFFAGSASTGHAVLVANSLDSGQRRYICIQIPEQLDTEKKEHKTAVSFCDSLGRPRNIAEISKERLRRAGKRIKEEYGGKAEIDKLDVGFRVLKVDTSNMKEVYYSPDTVSQDLLSEQISNIREDRSPEDLLLQILLDWGIDLTLPLTQEIIADKLVFFVDGNAMAACFDGGINEAFVKLLAKRTPLRAVFRDAGFASDSVKINVNEIFKLMSPSTEVKVI